MKSYPRAIDCASSMETEQLVSEPLQYSLTLVRVGPLTKKQKKDLLRGLFYINVHTANNPPGEIRGQVLGVKGPSKKEPAPAGSGGGGSY